MDSPLRLFGLLCIVSLSFGALTVPAAAQGVETPANGQLVVELDASGDAEAVFVDEYDLTDPRQRAIFESARQDEEIRREAAIRFREGMQSISEEASEGIDRELRIGEVTLEIAVDGEVGIVAYRFRWENLAAVDGDRVVLSEPFSTYDSLDRELIVIVPEGYELESVSPQPARVGEDAVAWSGLTAFGDRFEVVATPRSVHGDGPIALGVAALLLAALFIGRKR